MRKWQNLCRSQLRNKGERGITMKRDFLRELGIEDDNILKAILDKNMEEVNGAKPQDYDELKSNLEQTQSQLSEYEKQVNSLTEDYTKASEQINSLTADNEQFKLKDLKSNIVREYDLPSSVFDNITGSDEDTIRQSAENLASAFKSVKPAQPTKTYEAPIDDNNGLRETLRSLKGE